MTSFPSDQEQALNNDASGVQRIEHETITHYETTIPSETDVHRQPQKLFSFNDKIETSESLRQKAQALNSNEYVSNSNGNYYSAAAQPSEVDSKDLNSRLDKLLKSAETVLSRAKNRGGSVSAHHQVSSPIYEIDSALTFNTAEGNKRNVFTTHTPSVIPQEYSPASSQPSQRLGQSLSINSAELRSQNPMNLTPNALSHRYEPSPALEVQTSNNYNNMTVSYNLSSETQKRSGVGLSSIPVSSSIKYSPVDLPPVGSYTSRSYTVATETEQRTPPPQVPTTSYESQMQNMNTLPRSYNLFPIRETERSSHVSGNNNLDYPYTAVGGNDVSVLKKGINNVEDMLRTLDNIGTTGTQNQDLLTRTLTAQYNQNKMDYSNTEPFERENNSYISTIYPLKTKEYEVTEQPKKSFATVTNFEYSQSSNNIPNYSISNSYSPEAFKSSALRQSELEGQEKTQQAMKNIDHLMHKHIFQNRPLTRSTVDVNQPMRYMSPTRGSGTRLEANDFYAIESSRQWNTLQPQTQTFVSEQPRERDVRAVARSYRASLQVTPNISISEAPKSIQQFAQPYDSDVAVAAVPKENTYLSPVKDLALPRSYGSTTNYKEYLSSPRPAKSHLVSSPLPPDERELSYAENRTTERFKGTGLTFGQGIDYDRYYNSEYNPELLNSADRKMKKLTLKAKSPEERDSERRDQFRNSPSDIKEVHGAEYLFSEQDASHFDFRSSANEIFTALDSNRRMSPKAVPNQFKAGELMADKESSSRGDLHKADHPPHQNTYHTQSSVSHFKAGDLQPDHEGFRAGDLQPDRDQVNKAGELQHDQDAFRAGELQNDQDKQNFNAGELEDGASPQKAHQARNVADDGRAWQMVHKIDSRILESVEHSFDFDAALTPQNQQIPHESHKRGQAPTSEEKRLQRIVDPNLWIVNPPKVETYNASKGSQMLKQSIKKAHKKPIITHCFEKFEDREFATSNSKR